MFYWKLFGLPHIKIHFLELDKVLISVLNYNNFNSTKLCVTSLYSLNFKNTDIVIIDNASTDSSVILLRQEFNNIKIISSINNLGYAGGHKLAVNYALKNNYKFIWILNNDLTVKPETLCELIEAYKKYGNGLYGSISLKSENPDIVNFGGSTVSDVSRPFLYNQFEDVILEEYSKKMKTRVVQTIEGSSFLVPVKIIKKHGFMREDFFMYVEEVDYCYRLKKQFNISSYIVPTSVIIHKGGESFKNLSSISTYYKRRNHLVFCNENYNQSILNFIKNSQGIINLALSLLKGFIFLNKRDNHFFINLANYHALINKLGKLETKYKATK